MLDITKSLAYHGFKKIILLNGHGSNWPNLDLVARRTNLETDAECVPICWWGLLTVDKEFMPQLAAEQVPRRLFARLRAGDVAVSLPRRRQRPQGPDQERHDLVQRGRQPVHVGRPVRAPARRRSISWTSSYSETGVLGEAELATAEKGRVAYEEAVKQLARFITWFKDRPKDVRRDLHRTPPTMPIPWGQRPVGS